MSSTAALILGGLGLAGGVADAVIGATAASSAAGQENTQIQNAITSTNDIYATQQANQTPFINAGQSSIAQLLQGIQNGTFGSNTSFTAPTLAQAQQEPGYQFTQQQGQKGIEEAAAAGGGAVSGGTLAAAANYNQGLATTNYQQVYNNSLQGYLTNLQNQAQQFSQLYQPSALGESAATSLNQTGSTVAQTLASLLGQKGANQAAGTVGSANAITGGINTAVSGLSAGELLSALSSSGLIGGAGATAPPAAAANASPGLYTTPLTNVPAMGILPAAGAPNIDYGVGPG